MAIAASERLGCTYSLSEIKLRANAMRHDIITMVSAGKSGHPGGSLSCADILASLAFSGQLKINPDNPDDDERDYLIMSKGHASPALYALFHQLAWVKDEELMTFRQLGSRLQGHPDRHSLPGVEVCAGSLGQGLSVSVGAALAFKRDADTAAKKSEQNDRGLRRVYCVCGDGEMQEGSNWEALMLASHLKLDNLVMILDLNNLQIDGDVREVCSLGDIDAKLAAFGWDVQHINGHVHEEIISALKATHEQPGRPHAIICDTVKGKGVSFMENNAGWHGKAPNPEQTAQALAELDEALEELKANLKEVAHV